MLFSQNRFLHQRRYFLIRGFTQLEVLVIVGIIAIMAAIAIPSFLGMLDSYRVKQAATELQGSLQETQRSSIRRNQPCETRFIIPNNPRNSTIVEGSCLESGNRVLPKGVGMATNILPADSDAIAATPVIPTQQTRRSSLLVANATLADAGTLNFNPGRRTRARGKDSAPGQVRRNASPSEDTQSVDVNSTEETTQVKVQFGLLGAAKFEIAHESGDDSSHRNAKFVTYQAKDIDDKKQCVVLSGSLGLTRIGNYTGSLEPAAITSRGQCKALAWSEQL